MNPHLPSETELKDFYREVSQETGEVFFRSLVLYLAKAGRAEGAFIGEILGGARRRLRTVAASAQGVLVDNFECDLTQTPWEGNASLENRAWSRCVCGKFPQDHTFAKLGVGICFTHPLFDSSGHPLGLLAFLDTRPSHNPEAAEALVGSIAGRVLKELERTRTERLLNAEKGVLELLARNAPIYEVLTLLAKSAEEDAGDMLCAIFLADEQGTNLRLAAAPSLPGLYRHSLENMAIDPRSKPSGRAAYYKEPVYVADIATDPVSADHRQPALEYGLRACWAAPILSENGDLLGAFTLFCREPRAPSQRDLAMVDRAVRLAGIAIVHLKTVREQQESARKLRLLAENATEVILAYDMDRHLIYVNSSVEQQTGYSVEEMRRRQFINWVHPEDNERMMDLWEKLYQGQGYSGVEFRIITKSGQIKWILGSWGPLLDEGGKQIGVQGREIDITDRKEAEVRLRKSETSLARAQSIAHLGNWDQDLITGELFWSEETYRIFGLPPGQKLTSDSFFDCVASEDRELVRKAVQQAIEQKSTYAIDHRIIRPDGSERHVHEQAETYFDEEGRAFRLSGTVQDITESRRLAEQLRQSQKMEAVGQLAGGVAHDFNNLLTAIIGHSELLLNKLGQANPLRQEIEEIKKAGERAALVTKQLLAFSRKQVLQPIILDLNSLVESMAKMLRRLIREDIHFVATTYPGLWPVKADPGQMQQVILNLVLNARDAMPQGGTITIGVSNIVPDEIQRGRRTVMKQGQYVVLSVKDNGQGMDPATQTRIFEPFFTTKEQGKGTGLGLSTVYGIVKQSDGYIWVESELGKGARFEIYLPRAEEILESARQFADLWQPALDSNTILLVEDDDAVRNPIRGILERSGYQVLEACQGDQAMEIARQHKSGIDLILTDVVMPRMSGRELADRIVSLHPRTKVLYMSGYTDDALVGAAAEDEGREFIHKPFAADALVNKVRRVLEGAPGSEMFQ